MEATFRGNKYTKKALETLKHPTLRAMTKLPDRVYPRIVRAFFSSFDEGVDEDGNPAFTVTIDDMAYEFGYEDIAEALNIPKYKPKVYNTPIPTMRNALNFRPPVPEDGKEVTIVRTSYMHEDMWLVDMFLYYMFCPVTHNQERPIYLYKYWHGVQTGKGLDVPMLMVDMIHRVKSGGRKNKKPHNLIYPRSITAIMERLGYVFSDDEEELDGFWKFDYAMCSASFTKLAQIAGLEQPRRGPRGLIADLPESQAPAPRVRGKGKARRDAQVEEEVEEVHVEPGSSYNMTRSDFDAMIAFQQQSLAYQQQANEWRNVYGGRMDAFEENQERMEGRIDELCSMQQLYITDQYGEERANRMFAEARTIASAADHGRQSRRRRTRNQGGEDTPME